VAANYKHQLLSGESVVLTDSAELAFVRRLLRMGREKTSFFDVERAAIGPGSPALRGGNRVDSRIVGSLLYRVARDIATRVGIAEGLILAPEHEGQRDQVPTDGSMISVTQAADFLGISRAAVHKAIKEDRLKAQKIGNVVIVDRADCLRYAEERRRVDDDDEPAVGEPHSRQAVRSACVAKGR
jgi:excisionase family DNA binding protein